MNLFIEDAKFLAKISANKYLCCTTVDFLFSKLSVDNKHLSLFHLYLWFKITRNDELCNLTFTKKKSAFNITQQMRGSVSKRQKDNPATVTTFINAAMHSGSLQILKPAVLSYEIDFSNC